MTISLVARKARLDALRSAINANGGGAVHLYAAPEVPAPEVTPAVPPLAIVALAADCAVIGESGTQAALALVPVMGFAAATGTVAWARFVDGVGTAIVDIAAGPPGSGKQMIVTDNKPVPSALVYSGGEVQIASGLWLE